MNPVIPPVAIQGIPWSFHYDVASRLYGTDVVTENCAFAEIIDGVINGTYDHGIIAVENSGAGHIYANWDLLEKNPNIHIITEYTLTVHQCLVIVPGASLSDIQEVRSHPVALAQCSNFLSKYLPNARRVEWSDTALAAESIMQENNPRVAAIAGPSTQELFGVHILEQGIANGVVNQTRFFTIARRENPISLLSGEKSSLVLTLPHRPWALAHLLTQIAWAGANLSQIISRPIPEKPFEYSFLIDIEVPGSCDASALEKSIRKGSDTCAILGTYGSTAHP